MVRVPTRDVAVADIGRAPVPETRIATPLAAFGGAGARALQIAGQALSGTAQTLANVAVEQQDKRDTTLAVDNYNVFRDRWREQETGFKSRLGVDAFGLGSEATREFDKLVEELSGQLEGGAKRRFQALAQQSRNSSLDVMARHESQQSNKAFENQMAALSSTAINDGIENFQDSTVTENSELVIDSSVRALLRGQSEEVVEAAIRGRMTELHTGIVSRLSDIDVDSAQEHLEANKDKMDASVVGNLEKTLAQKANAERAEELVATHYDEEAPIDDITSAIQQSGQPQVVKDEAVRRALNRRTIDDAGERDRREKAFEAAVETVRETGIDSLSVAVLNDLTQEDIDQLQAEDSRIKSGLAVVNNSQIWQEIVTMGPEELAGKDIHREYGSQLDSSHFDRALALQGAARALLAGSDPDPKQVREGDYTTALRIVASNAGLISEQDSITKIRQNTDEDAQRFQIFDEAFRREVDTWLANNPGKQLSRTEITDMGNALIADTVLVDAGFFSREEEVPLIALTSEDIEDAFLPDGSITVETRDAMLGAFPNRRTRLTRGDVADMLLDVQLGRPIDRVGVSDIPRAQLDSIKAAFERRGRRFVDEVERDQAYLDLYIKGVLSAIR